jgi:hypothetical protein
MLLSQVMKNLIIGLFLVTSTLLFVAGGLYWVLRAPVPSESDVVGLYTGTNDGYRDQVEILPDHRFIQTLKKPNGEIIMNHGSWTLKNRALDISGYSLFIDIETGKALSDPIKSGGFPFAVYPEYLIFDWGSGFYKLTKH